MDWDDLRYLLAVHQRGTLAAAARELKVTKATASRRLAALEASLGTSLFERKPDGLSLTAAGKEVLEAAKGMEDLAATVEGRVTSGADARPRGTVWLTAPQWLAARFLIPALPELKARHPELEVELLGTDQILNLAQREADLALRNVRPTQRSLTARRVAELGGCVYASHLYLERRGIPRGPDAIDGHDVLVYEGLGGMPGFEWLRDPSRGGRIAFRANDPASLVSAATAGLGLTAVPCFLGDAEAALARVETLGYSRTEMFLVTHEQIRRTARVRVTSEFVAELMARHRTALEG